MGYADITFKDKNRIKRWLQRSRLSRAIRLASPSFSDNSRILDFGAGNGELLRVISRNYSSAGMICYEPAPDLMIEAVANLAGLKKIEYFRSVDSITSGSVDLVFCLEVFEHLTAEAMLHAIEDIGRILADDGLLVIGVPVELWLPAFYKGVFRRIRRHDAFDSKLKNIILSGFGFPPRVRPVGEIVPGLSYHFEHMGFDYRILKSVLKPTFEVVLTETSPFALPGPFFMPEINVVCRKKQKIGQPREPTPSKNLEA